MVSFKAWASLQGLIKYLEAVMFAENWGNIAFLNMSLNISSEE